MQNKQSKEDHEEMVRVPEELEAISSYLFPTVKKGSRFDFVFPLPSTFSSIPSNSFPTPLTSSLRTFSKAVVYIKTMTSVII